MPEPRRIVQVFGANQTGNILFTCGWKPGEGLNFSDAFAVEGMHHVNPVTEAEVPIDIIFMVTDDCRADANGHLAIPIHPGIRVTAPYRSAYTSPVNGALLRLSSIRAAEVNSTPPPHFHGERWQDD